MLRYLLLLIILILSDTPVTSTHRTDVAVSKFTTQTQINNLRWSAITDLHQSINPLLISSTGVITPLSPNTWPMKSLINLAHGKGANIIVSVHMASKSAATNFLSPLNKNLISETAKKLVQTAVDSGFNGISIDIEGLKYQSKVGYELFIYAISNEIRTSDKVNNNFKLLSTIYGMKLLKDSSIINSAYNISKLTRLGYCDYVFIMGYDMTWLGAKGGSGKTEAGPNSPLNSLDTVLENSIRFGANPSKLVLGIPFYGDLYTCNGNIQPKFGNCSTTIQKKKKSIDILANAAVTSANCIQGFDINAGSPFFDCPHGTNIPGGSGKGIRQQGWYENLNSIKLKLNLANKYELEGIGIWTAGGVNDVDGPGLQGKEIWNAIDNYANDG